MGAGEEGISAVRIGMVLTLFAAVIVIVVYNVIWGQNIARDFIGQADRAQTQSINRYFQETLVPEGAEMPTSGAYSLIEYNLNDVDNVTFSTTSTKADDINQINSINRKDIDKKLYWLRTNLYGKCIVKATPNGEGYNLTVRFTGYSN